MQFHIHKFLINACILIGLPFLFLYPTDMSAQGWDWNNLNVEVGAEYNIMMIMAETSGSTVYRNDADFGVRPRMEINYKLNLADQFNLHTFIRYANRGRTERITEEEFVYTHYYESSLPTFSVGGKLFYNLDPIQIAPVIAFNSHFGIDKWAPYRAGTDAGIKDFSIDGGLSLRYNVNDHFYVAADGMYGITNLYQDANVGYSAYTAEFKTMRLFYTSFNLGFSL